VNAFHLGSVHWRNVVNMVLRLCNLLTRSFFDRLCKEESVSWRQEDASLGHLFLYISPYEKNSGRVLGYDAM
jgi:hypothetical protein